MAFSPMLIPGLITHRRPCSSKRNDRQNFNRRTSLTKVVLPVAYFLTSFARATATAITSNRAPKSSLFTPMNARAGKSSWKDFL